MFCSLFRIFFLSFTLFSCCFPFLLSCFVDAFLTLCQDKYVFLHQAAIGFYKQQSRFLSSSTGLFHTPNPAFMDPEAVSVADSLADDTRAKDRGYTEVSAEEEPIKRMKKKNRNKGGKGNSGFAEEAEWSLSSGTDDDEMSEMVRLPRRTVCTYLFSICVALCRHTPPCFYFYISLFWIV